MSKIDSLLQTLETKTASGRIQWIRTENERAFEAQFESGSSVWILQYTWFDEHDEVKYGYRATVFDNRGDVIDTIDHKDSTANLQVLYESARRNAMNADEIIGDLLEELEEA